MALDSSNYKIHIATTADTTGLDVTIAKLKGQIEATKQLGQATGDLEKKLEKAQSDRIAASLDEITGKTKAVGEASKKAAEGTGEFIEGRHGIHAIGHALNEAVPGIMQFTRFLTSGFTAAIGVVVLAFAYLNQQVENFKKFLDDVDSGPGARGEWASKIADNTREASVEMAAFNEQLHAAAVAQETLDKLTDRLIAHQKDQAAAANEVGDAQKQLDLARLALAEKLKQVSPDQAVLIRLEIDDAAFKRQLAAEKAALQGELAARQQEWNANQDSEPSLHASMTLAGAATLAAKNAQDKNAAKLTQDQSNLAGLPDRIKAAEAAIEERRHGIGGLAVPESELKHDPEYQAAQGQLTQLYRLQGSYRTSIRQESGKQQPLEEAAALSKQQFERAKSDYEAAAKLSEDTSHTISDLQAKLAGVTAKDAALQSLHDQTSAATRAGQNADLHNRVIAGHGTPAEIAQDAAWRTQAHYQQLSGGELSQVASNARAAMSDARSAVQAGRGNDGQLHELLNEFIGMAHDIHANAVQRAEFTSFQREVETLRRQIAINRTSP